MADPLQDPRLAKLVQQYLAPLGWTRAPEDGPVAADGSPLPWITYPAIHVLAKLARPAMRVFEFGCGHSSLWWAARVAEVASIDHDEAWAARVRQRAASNQTVLHRPMHVAPCEMPRGMAGRAAAIVTGQFSSGDAFFDTYHGHNCGDFLGYASTLLAWPPGYFDVVVVDGMARSLCAYFAAHWVKPSGIVVFDNTERVEYQAGYDALREAGFGRIDFFGPSPVNDFPSCTSLFVRDVAAFLATEAPRG